ncbi:hypothetical protein OIU84_018879 [Salix udensis]|uniref:EGF-like domain-containing protein n=1 Tax=Salix udensis TaxID=889485 RepID=A0AAD6PIZ0_9ROSI|nr:hypothetical protein OIU84_018879 [Salix udensis]
MIFQASPFINESRKTRSFRSLVRKDGKRRRRRREVASYLHFSRLSSMMCAKKWNVGKETASRLVIVLGSMNVNVDPGWKQVSSDDHKFLPCIVPNCTLNLSCMPAPSPVQDKASKDNESIFDPCFWTDCGGGSCNKTSTFTHSCTCAEGYNNLLNIPALPCYRDCAIGVDCQNLGISVSNKSASPTPVMVDSSKNQDSSILQEKFHWLMALIVLLSMIDWV